MDRVAHSAHRDSGPEAQAVVAVLRGARLQLARGHRLEHGRGRVRHAQQQRRLGTGMCTARRVEFLIQDGAIPCHNSAVCND